jgi:hypothetical protein
MQYEQFNPKYHIMRPDINPNSLFSSFKVFKTFHPYQILGSEERPPFPILIDDPTIGQVFQNLNKSDFLLGLSFTGLGFLMSILTTRKLYLLSQKFYLTKHTMWLYSIIGAFLATQCSYYRLIGFLDNGLRWKHKDLLYSKYDFTKDFEVNTVFKHFRERVD